ncbi:sodium-coupled monocarboxylate transporter 2-like [Brachionus plicatilis]|uniref:Sodium-coupled monocarboxylate transporter 2-like n=1 Tax=Brachionus plicatilis TaxID=10195 RepID=A0A3M7P7R3_BRAPC|nr:sodium-coupled monocarboxylate transporter 2-like [Brachionus plicatilis]
MIIFAYYNGCNILKDKPVEQLFPIYIMDAMQSTPGIPGIFLSVLFAAVLSSMSSGLNGLSATIIEDFLKGQAKIGDRSLAKISKILCLIFGLLIMILSYVAHLINNSLQTVLSLFR